MQGGFFMFTYEDTEKYLEELKQREEQSRKIKQERERKLKRQCGLLGAAAVLLAAAASFARYYDSRIADVYQTDTKDGKGDADTYEEEGQRIMSWQDEADTGTDYSTDLLILVNKDNPLPEDFAVELHWLQNRSCAVAESMYSALSEMLSAGSEEGLSFVVASGYRDTKEQQELLEEDIAATMEREGVTWQEAYEKETRETMPPGYSEHETGLAVDIVSLYYQVLDERQEMTEESRWLREHCSEYGFILRYPKGNEDVTGIDYESWHFRYVGKEVAEEIMKRGITLEEYLEKQ